jgi:hypothetical protein
VKTIALAASLLAIGMIAAAACYDAPAEEPEGPPPAGPGRELVRLEYRREGERVPIRESAQVPDPVNGGARVSLRLRNLGDAASGAFNPATLNLGAGAGNAVSLPTTHGTMILYARRDGTLGAEPDAEPLAGLEIPSVEGGALSFSAVVEPLVLAGVYLYELDVTAVAGPTTIEVTVTAE